MRRPWNLINCPVYSLATYQEGVVNMNICTYVTAVSMQPKLYTIAIYKGTKTLENLQHSTLSVLQFLNKQHTSLVRPLGKKSGYKSDKATYLKKKNLLTEWQKKEVLSNCNAYLLLEKLSVTTTGDHDLFFFKVLKYKTQSEQNILMFQDLVDQKIIL